MDYVSSSFDALPNASALSFFHRLHLVYARNAKLFLTIVTPAALFSAFVVYVTLVKAGELAALGRAHQWSLAGAPGFNKYLLASGAMRFAGTAISWIVNVFAFAAVARAVASIRDGTPVSAEDCFAPARAQVKTIVVLALALLGLAVPAFLASSAWVALSFFFDLPRWIWIGSYPVLALGSAYMATYALSVPVAVLEGAGVKAALRKSGVLTEHSFGLLLLLVSESLVSGYVAALAPYWIANMVAHRIGWAVWGNWILWGAAVYGVALADLVLLIGLSVLYLELANPAAQAGAASAMRWSG